jgi:tetratricopeptide (TPR) repeat protein
VAINKAKTPLWMKTTLVVLAIVFVFGFLTIGASPFISNQNASNNNTSTDPLAAVNQQFQPTVASITGMLQSQPESYTLLVALGNTYFDWAIQTQQASQTSTASTGADVPLWTSAKDAYSRAYSLSSTDSPVAVDYAITTFYTGDTLGAIKIAEKVAKQDPKFAPAHFNLGVFYKAIGEKAKAIAEYERYIALDPTGKQGNLEYAKTELAGLKSNTATP